MNRFRTNFLKFVALLTTTPGNLKSLKIELGGNDGQGDMQVRTFNEADQIDDAEIKPGEIALKSYRKSKDGTAKITLVGQKDTLDKWSKDIKPFVEGLKQMFDKMGVTEIAGLHDETAATVTYNLVTTNGGKVTATEIKGVKDTFVLGDQTYGLTSDGIYELDGDTLGKQLKVIVAKDTQIDFVALTSVSREIDKNVFLNYGHDKAPLIGQVQTNKDKVEIIVRGEAAMVGQVFGPSASDKTKVVVRNGNTKAMPKQEFLQTYAGA